MIMIIIMMIIIMKIIIIMMIMIHDVATDASPPACRPACMPQGPPQNLLRSRLPACRPPRPALDFPCPVARGVLPGELPRGPLGSPERLRNSSNS